MGGDNGGRVFKDNYKGHMDKTKGEGGNKGGQVGLVWGGKWWGVNADYCN